MRAITKATDWLVTASTIVGVAGILIMITHICLDVFMRNVFLAPVPATSVVVANYYMPIIAFLPLALTEKLDQHVTVDLLYAAFPDVVQRWLLRLVRLTLCVLTAYVAFHFLKDALRKYELNSYVKEAGLEVPDWPGYFTLPVGFALLSIILFSRLLQSFAEPGQDTDTGDSVGGNDAAAAME